MKQERWVLRDDIKIQQFVDRVNELKRFTPEYQAKFLRQVFEFKMDRMLASGIKKRRKRKKEIKRQISQMRTDLEYHLLDCLKRVTVDVPEGYKSPSFDSFMSSLESDPDQLAELDEGKGTLPHRAFEEVDLDEEGLVKVREDFNKNESSK